MEAKAQAMLDRYLATLTEGERARHRDFEAFYFCADEECANTCARLVLSGDKRATASLLWSYEAEDEPLPQVGGLVVVTDWAHEPQCIIEIISVEVRAFKDVDAAFAFEEGEGDKSLAWWREAHWRFFGSECEELGREPSEEMPIVLERFKRVYPAG